jgi:hypothetical protein
LQVTYHHLSESEHGWHYARKQLELTHVEVGTHTHMIIHLEHHIKQQDLDLKERAATITALDQQLQVLQL